MDPEQVPGVVASAVEVLEIAEVGRVEGSPFSPAEQAYARSKPDPERRLAARLAAKRAAVRLLGDDIALSEVEVLRGRGGPPRVRLSPRAEQRLRERGAQRMLVSLTHGEERAAASVLLLAAE